MGRLVLQAFKVLLVLSDQLEQVQMVLLGRQVLMVLLGRRALKVLLVL
jgi:hypothetical protein